MKKYVFSILLIICFLPIINVNACSLTISGKEGSTTCTAIDDSVVNIFYYDNKDYSKYFSVSGDAIYYENLDEFMKTIPVSQKSAVIEIKNGNKLVGTITVNNLNYVEQTTTTNNSTTTTQVAGEKTFTVTLMHNDGSEEISKRTCTVSGNDNECAVTLPTLENDNFNGWGTAPTCKDGSSGTIRLQADTTLYACYENQEQTTTTSNQNNVPMLKTLKLFENESTKEIDFGVFSIRQNDYEFTVLNSVNSIKVEHSVDEGINVVIMGNNELKDGENIITIKLIDENNKENLYTLKVNRLKAGEKIDKNNYLSMLNVGGYNIGFDKNKFDYTLTIGSDIKTLQLTYDVENTDNIIREEGNNDLVNGSVITLKVISPDKNETIYRINIVKEEKSNNIVLIISIIIILIILGLTLYVFFMSHKKQKQNPDGSNNTKKDKPVVKKTVKEKKVKSAKNKPEVLPDNKSNDIEVLKF